MEEHPDCEPGSAVAVNSGYDNDAERNEDFERKRIDNGRLPGNLFYGIAGVNPCARSTGDVKEVGKTLFL